MRKYPHEPYRLDQGFGIRRPDGTYHEGWDTNKAGTAGNQDLGTPLFAWMKGEIIHYSRSSKWYGNILVQKVWTPRGYRYIRYCHLQKLFHINGVVDSNTVIATMGSTGNSTASHLHLDIFKKVPPTWRFYAGNNLKTLQEYMIDPKEFYQVWFWLP